LFTRCGAIVLAALPITGCAAPGDREAPMRPIRFVDGAQRHVATVYGPLGSRLPGFDETPLLDLFLYGPNDYGKTALRNPQGMTTLGSKLLVCDQGYPDVVAIDLATGQSMRFLDADHLPRCPVDVATDATGRVYVADTTLRRVLIYDGAGRFLTDTLPTPDDGPRFRPAAMAIRDGMLYVCNLAGPAVERFHLGEQKWLAPLVPPDGKLVSPAGIDVDELGSVYIADAVGATVERVSADGQWLEAIGRPGRRPGELVRPKQVLVCRDQTLLVTDAGRQSLCLFRVSDGAFLLEIHERPDEWNGLTLPMGLVRLDGGWQSLATDDNPETADDAAVSDEDFLVVSDSLGGDSLTLIGLKTETREGGRP
jgi:sugar lactone lactonase YvrE